MKKFEISYDKSLKLTNACIRETTTSEIDDIDRIIAQMENYIRSKGVYSRGPLIQRTYGGMQDGKISTCAVNRRKNMEWKELRGNRVRVRRIQR